VDLSKAIFETKCDPLQLDTEKVIGLRGLTLLDLKPVNVFPPEVTLRQEQNRYPSNSPTYELRLNLNSHPQNMWGKK